MTGLPFTSGDQVKFKTLIYEGTGHVVGITPCVGYCNYGIVIQYETIIQYHQEQSKNPYFAFPTVVVPLYDPVESGLGHNNERCVLLMQ